MSRKRAPLLKLLFGQSPVTTRLKTQAWIVSVILLLLTGILGAKAYSVARIHIREMSELVNYDLQAQSLVSEDDNLRKPLELYREEKLTHAHRTAMGLLKLIVVAMLMSAAITSWLLFLLFRGLLRPLETLTNATHRIGNGELSWRIKSRSGIAELQDLAQAFNSMAERLEKLDHAKAEFLAMISHEIKNPMAALKEGLSLLMNRGDSLPAPARARGFHACLIASKRLESMINNLLQHSRMEAGFFGYDPARKDLLVSIQTALDEVRPLAEKKNIRFEMIAGTPENALASFNADGMIQVFENLFLNAIKYGSENSQVDIETDRIGDDQAPDEALLQIRVTNCGPTIDPDELTRIFDVFYRGSNTSKHPGVQGMGLGLHVVKTIIQAHNGTVSVTSHQGRTTFQICIPTTAQGCAPGLKTAGDSKQTHGGDTPWQVQNGFGSSMMTSN